MPGLIGRFFREFGLTVAAKLIASTFTALTLAPMVTSKLIRVSERQGILYQWPERGFKGLESIYARLLETPCFLWTV
jgi:multidrug efflux pump